MIEPRNASLNPLPPSVPSPRHASETRPRASANSVLPPPATSRWQGWLTDMSGIRRGTYSNIVTVSFATMLGALTPDPAKRAVVQGGVLASSAVVALGLWSCGLSARGRCGAVTHLSALCLSAIPLGVGLYFNNANFMIANVPLALYLRFALAGSCIDPPAHEAASLPSELP